MRSQRVLGVFAVVAAISCARVQPVTVMTAVTPIAAPSVDAPAASGGPASDSAVVIQQAALTWADSLPLDFPRLDVQRPADAGKPTEAEIAVPVIAAPEGPTWDIDVHSYETTTRVAHYVSHFSGPAREYIQTRLSDGTRFEGMIRGALRNGGIPEDMYYLALVESGFDPNAYSRAAAVGMWQFMASTGRDMGLRVDWWIDERRDPVKSTKAAVEFIRGLRDQFGSIYLAAAAYNGGPGRIARGLTRYADDLDGTAGDDLFFALADKKVLTNETRDYVPQIIAAALIAKNPSRYGMEITTRPAYAYDSVTVPSMTSLAAIAGAAGCTVADLRMLNPQILRGMTPPDVQTEVKIPAGTVERFDSAFAMVPDSLRIGARVVRTRGGERPEKLSKLTGIPARQIGWFNKSLKRTKSGAYRADQTIYVPRVETVAAASSVPDPSIERWGSSATGSHVVARGETLGSIAKRYHMTTVALLRLNGLKRSIIFPGQMILTSASGRASARKSSMKKPSAQ